MIGARKALTVRPDTFTILTTSQQDHILAAVALCLPFVSEVWQVYALILVLQSASAAFTPTFQATIPDILPQEERYTRALSLSRLAYDLENLISPILAAILLAFISYQALFVGTVIGIAGSALLVVSVLLPSPRETTRCSIYERTLAMGFISPCCRNCST